jgi:ATP-dependent Clp protease ATP-binding subunit ClpX
MLEMDGVSLEFEDDALAEIASLAIKRGTGARGLRAILEEILLNTMFDMPSRSDIGRVVVDADAVRNRTNPTLVPHPDLPRERSA